MAANVQIHIRVKKAIRQMKTQSNAPKIAAVRADDVIRSLARGILPAHSGRLLRKKDARVKNLFKFNLGKGYRLLTVKGNDTFHVLFIGPHDLCDRYLDSQRKKKPHKKQPTVPAEDVAPIDNIESGPYCLGQETHQDDSLPHISQQDLRRVFCGLAGCEQR